MADAALAMGEADVVLGPALDGGYYLVAMARPHAIFSELACSTALVLQQTRARVQDPGLPPPPPTLDAAAFREAVGAVANASAALSHGDLCAAATRGETTSAAELQRRARRLKRPPSWCGHPPLPARPVASFGFGLLPTLQRIY